MSGIMEEEKIKRNQLPELFLGTNKEAFQYYNTDLFVP